ncbi:MAG TPA: radical SAM protein [Myxococcota bacterium]|nr:radical SAM protein [Myxococcota bacterium]
MSGVVSASRAAQALPFPDLLPTVEWQVGGHCNYDCSYCIQSKKSRVGQPDEARVDRILDGLAALPRPDGLSWEVKMSGGEPFAARLFLERIVPGLVERTPHKVSVLTNFSAPEKSLERFARLTGERLRITSASLHLESVEPGPFLAKARFYRDVRKETSPASSFVINSVVVPSTVARLLDVQAECEAEGFRFFPQLMKVKGGVFDYGPDERPLVERLLRGSFDPREVNRAPSYEGLHCEAGVWYFTLDQDGEAWSCRTEKRHARAATASKGPAIAVTRAAQSLGNMVHGTFALRDAGGPCPYTICPCTVPANRGIVRLPTTLRSPLPEVVDV